VRSWRYEENIFQFFSDQFAEFAARISITIARILGAGKRCSIIGDLFLSFDDARSLTRDEHEDYRYLIFTHCSVALFASVRETLVGLMVGLVGWPCRCVQQIQCLVPQADRSPSPPNGYECCLRCRGWH